MLSVLCFKVLRKMQRRHSSNTDSAPPERNRSQTVSSETSVDESGVFESLKAETSSPQQLFSGLAGIPSGSITAAPFQSGLVLGSSAGGGEVFIQMPAPREEGAGRTEGAPFHHRQQPHHFHHGHHRGSALLHMAGGDRHGHAEEGSEEQAGTPAPALSELKAVVGWLQKGLPFILILLAKVCFQHKLGIAVCIGMASTFAYANSTLREQVALKVSTASCFLLLPSSIPLSTQNIYTENSFATEGWMLLFRYRSVRVCVLWHNPHLCLLLPTDAFGKGSRNKSKRGKVREVKPASGSATGWQCFIKHFSVPQFPIVCSRNQLH